MKYYITYRIKEDPDYLNIDGPYPEFNYIHKVVDILSAECVFDIDIVNEIAMEIYQEYMEVESEYEAARKILAESPRDPDWTLQKQVDFQRELNSLPVNIDLFSDPDNAIQTIDNIKDIAYDPWDCPF